MSRRRFMVSKRKVIDAFLAIGDSIREKVEQHKQMWAIALGIMGILTIIGKAYAALTGIAMVLIAIYYFAEVNDVRDSKNRDV